MRDLSSGYSTVEMIIVLGISLTLMAFVIPPVNAMLIRSKTTSSINRLVAAVNFTRHTAVQYHTVATLCATKANGKCGASWAGELSVFLDRNSNDMNLTKNSLPAYQTVTQIAQLPGVHSRTNGTYR